MRFDLHILDSCRNRTSDARSVASKFCALAADVLVSGSSLAHLKPVVPCAIVIEAIEAPRHIPLAIGDDIELRTGFHVLVDSVERLSIAAVPKADVGPVGVMTLLLPRTAGTP
jgi:hypothetical protein